MLNTQFLLASDCHEFMLRQIRKHKNRCKTGSTGRPVNMDFRNELCRILLDKFKGGKKVKTVAIQTEAMNLSKTHPFLLDNSLQRMQFRRRWCVSIQLQLASGIPFRSGGTSGFTDPGLSSFSLDSFCSTCVGKAYAGVDALFSHHEPSHFLLVLIKKEVQVEVE
jgi:hypothetical protein